MSTTTFDPPEELLEGTRQLSRHLKGRLLHVRMSHERQCRRERKGD